jgi:hydrogenase maturation protease
VHCLVIGYGNDLRGDDGLGRRAAEAVADWQLPGVEVLSVHQLTPELAEPLAHTDFALFLDAHPAQTDPDLRVQSVSSSRSESGVGHSADPACLLACADHWFGRRPASWSITMPAVDFAFGAPLSPIGAHALAEGLRTIRALIESVQRRSGTAPACDPAGR